MQSRGKLAVAIAIASAFFGYQFLIHKISVSGNLTVLSAALILIPFVVAVTWLIAAEIGLRYALAISFTLILLCLLAFRVLGFPQPAIILGMPHLAANSFLMWFFGRTLTYQREPLITTLARKVHGSLPPELVSYTRHVTIAWTLFFAMQISCSIGLYSFASLEAWSTFINILSSPLIVLMFLCEYTYRVLRYRDHRSSPFDGLKIFSNDPPASKSAKVR